MEVCGVLDFLEEMRAYLSFFPRYHGNFIQTHGHFLAVQNFGWKALLQKEIMFIIHCTKPQKSIIFSLDPQIMDL